VQSIEKTLMVKAARFHAQHYATTLAVIHNYYATDIFLDKAKASPSDFSAAIADKITAAHQITVRYFTQPAKTNPPLQQDPFIKAAFSHLQKDPQNPYWETDTIDNKPVLRFAFAFLFDKPSHHTPLAKPSQTIPLSSIQEIILPLDKIKATTHLYVTGCLVLFILLVSIGLFNFLRYLKQLEKNLSAQHTAISKLNQQNKTLQDGVEQKICLIKEKNKALAKDQQQLKGIQKQLVTQEKMASMGVLAAGIAHEIKNPLNFINNFADITKDLVKELKEALNTIEQNETAKKKIDHIIDDIFTNTNKINEHGKRAENTIHNMLIHARTVKVEKTPIDINHLLEEYLNLAYHGMRAQNNQFNIKIEKNLKPNLEKVIANQQNLGRVFLNIINNGLYAANEKEQGKALPTIYINTFETEKEIIIKIKDNGKGMTAKTKSKIFEPFFTTKPVGKGTGLGLPICYDIIVKEHHGKLEVNSSLGEYTEFIISLPKTVK